MRVALLLCGIASLAFAQVKDMRLVLTFESQEQVAAIKASGASVQRVGKGGAGGGYALELRFQSGKRAQVEIPVTAGDWQGYGSLALDATNTSTAPAYFSVEVRDQAGAFTVGQVWWDLAPGEKATYSLSLNQPPPSKMGMEHEPPSNNFRILGSDFHPVDLAKIACVRISMVKLPEPRTVVFGNFRLGPGASYDKIVDGYGQYTRRDWPGKVKNDADLKAQLAKEREELNAASPMPDRDEYGGWAAGPKLEATGYFRTVKQEGKWWLVTPSGHLFFSLGLDTVRADESETVVEGRKQMFEWLPGAGDPLAAHFRTLGENGQPTSRAFNFYTANLERKYGKDWYDPWQAMSTQRLSAWGFNTVAIGSDPRLYDLKKAPYTGTLEICAQESGRGRCPELEQLRHVPPFPLDMWNYDTFDPRFPEVVDRHVRAFASERRNDPWMIGYFVDNELPWGFMRNDRTRYALALEVLSLSAASPAKRALVGQLKTRYSDIAKLNAAWNAQLASWEELLQKPYRPKGELTAAAREDMGAFVKELAARYFRTVRDTLRKYDPNHLYLGVRFAWLLREHYSWTTAEVEEAAVQYCDVISFNVYLPGVDARWDFLKQLDKPTIIGEFNITVPDRGIYPDIVVGADTQEERARKYQDFVRSVVDHPDFVGCHFWQYIDEPVTGEGEGENTGTGFVTLTDTPYPEMVTAAKAVHAEVYRRRGSGSAAAGASR